MGAGTGFAEDPIVELKTFSRFNNVSLEQISNQEVILIKGEAMDFTRGLTGEACFVLPTNLEKTIASYRKWDTSKDESLKVFYHRNVQMPPSDNDFKELTSIFKDSRFRWLNEKTKALNPSRTDLFLNKSELVCMFQILNSGKESLESITRGWREVLQARVIKHQSEGLSKNFRYEAGRSEIDVQSDLKSILKEQPKIRKQFSSLLEKTILSANIPSSDLTPIYYWELSEIDKRPAFILGVIYITQMNQQNVYQILDCIFYASSGIYTQATLRQLWPVSIDGRQSTLVWRGDLVSAPDLEPLRGIERMAASKLMLQEMKKTILSFRRDVSK